MLITTAQLVFCALYDMIGASLTNIFILSYQSDVCGHSPCSCAVMMRLKRVSIHNLQSFILPPAKAVCNHSEQLIKSMVEKKEIETLLQVHGKIVNIFWKFSL